MYVCMYSLTYTSLTQYGTQELTSTEARNKLPWLWMELLAYPTGGGQWLQTSNYTKMNPNVLVVLSRFCLLLQHRKSTNAAFVHSTGFLFRPRTVAALKYGYWEYWLNKQTHTHSSTAYIGWYFNISAMVYYGLNDDTNVTSLPFLFCYSY